MEANHITDSELDRRELWQKSLKVMSRAYINAIFFLLMETAVIYAAAEQIVSERWCASYHVNLPKYVESLNSELKLLCYGSYSNCLLNVKKKGKQQTKNPTVSF